MDAVLCLRETTHFQSMELERPEAICGLESGTRSRLWSTRGHCACRQEVAFFGLRLARTEIACLNQFSSVFSWLQVCRHRGDHESNACVVLTRCSQSCEPCCTLDVSTAFIVNRYLGRLPMRLLKGSAADSEVGDGLMGLWSDGRPTESYPETGSRELAGLVTTIRLVWIDFRHSRIRGTGCSSKREEEPVLMNLRKWWPTRTAGS
jgi:hypothetical protein